MTINYIKSINIYNYSVFILLFIFGISKNIGRYIWPNDLNFLRQIHSSSEYIFYLPYLLLILIPLIDKNWRNKFFLIPIIFGNSIFGGTLFLYLIIKNIFEYNQFELSAMLHYFIMLIFSCFVGFFLYLKRLWAIYIFLIFCVIMLVATISIHFFTIDDQFFKSNWIFTLPLIFIVMISYFIYIIKSLKENINNKVTLDSP